MTIAVTGGFGFLGWHVSCRLRALHATEPVRLGRADFTSAGQLARRLADVDRIIHVAGVNRAASDAEVEQANVAIAQTLADAIRLLDRPLEVVFANSVQAMVDNPYGRGKARAAEILATSVQELGGTFADLLLPNLFGEHGRPGYNSFVATFAHEVISGRTPTVTGDRVIELLHAQAAASELVAALGTSRSGKVSGEPVGIGDVSRMLQEFHDLYIERGEIPDVSSGFARDLFNTYRAAAFPEMWPIRPQLHSDDRGDLFEAVRSHGGTGMTFASTTRPGQKRGEHYHLHKIERFVVVRGEAEIQLRRLLHREITSFRIDGRTPTVIDMPTLWVHNIRNIGTEDLVTMFWADQLLDPITPDQFPESVSMEESQ